MRREECLPQNSLCVRRCVADWFLAVRISHSYLLGPTDPFHCWCITQLDNVMPRVTTETVEHTSIALMCAHRTHYLHNLFLERRRAQHLWDEPTKWKEKNALLRRHVSFDLSITIFVGSFYVFCTKPTEYLIRDGGLIVKILWSKSDTTER